jgi:hypothetical protein
MHVLYPLNVLACPLNVLSSFCFLISAMYAAELKHHRVELCCYLIFTSSVIYYSCRWRSIKYIDMFLVHACAIYFNYEFIRFDIRYLLSVFISISMVVIYWIIGSVNDVMHSMLHVFGNIAVMLSLPEIY